MIKFLSQLILLSTACSEAILFPRESESREIKDLSGRWKFRVDDSPDRNHSFKENWWTKPLHESGHVIDMPVPASYNDVTQSKAIRDFVGWAWYETTFFAPKSWSTGVRVWLRIGSAHYNAIAYVNAAQVMQHAGGHLPFECDVSNKLNFGATNRLTVAVNNTLTPHTLPPGTYRHYSTEDGYPDGYFTQEYNFDFFNYAGIHRPVTLYTTPEIYIGDIATSSEVDGNLINSALNYDVEVGDSRLSPKSTKEIAAYNVTVVLKDKEGNVVKTNSGASGQFSLSNQPLWWPVGMNDTVGYLYTLEVHLSALAVENAPLPPTDIYRLPVGIRTVRVEGNSFLINGRPFYFHGVGKHEDWDVRGKGFDWPMVIKDFNLLDWLGGNSFRTSHYPYSEEIMQMCDERGIVVVDECPAVGLKSSNNFVNATLQHHLEVMNELVSRDRNHPSVVMWSVANEPASQLPAAASYFKTVLDHVRSLDSFRPATFVCSEEFNTDVATPYVDVVCINRYEGWYIDPGHSEVIQGRVTDYLENWYKTRSKPIILMEWGAGAISGFHVNPAAMYSEGYLVELMKEHFTVFDSMRTKSNPYLIGEMVWNFADFATAQSKSRMLGNRKGLFTRARQPKWPAYVIRERYRSLLNQTKVKQLHKHSMHFSAVEEEFDISFSETIL